MTRRSALTTRDAERSRCARSAIRMAAAAGLAVALLACSGNDESSTSDAPTSSTSVSVDSSSPTTSPATTAPATQLATSTPTPPPSTPPVAPTTSTAATSPSTVPPTGPATVPLGAAESLVADAYRASFDSWTECLRALPTCPLESLATTRAAAYLDAAVVQAGRYNEAGQTVEGLETRAATVESVELIDDTQARVIVCEVDGSVRRDSSGAVINDSFDSARVLLLLSAADGTWKVVGSENLEAGSGPEGNVCAR
jgi:hypothetical protein